MIFVTPGTGKTREFCHILYGRYKTFFLRVTPKKEEKKNMPIGIGKVIAGLADEKRTKKILNITSNDNDAIPICFSLAPVVLTGNQRLSDRDNSARDRRIVEISFLS